MKFIILGKSLNFELKLVAFINPFEIFLFVIKKEEILRIDCVSRACIVNNIVGFLAIKVVLAGGKLLIEGLVEQRRKGKKFLIFNAKYTIFVSFKDEFLRSIGVFTRSFQ